MAPRRDWGRSALWGWQDAKSREMGSAPRSFGWVPCDWRGAGRDQARFIAVAEHGWSWRGRERVDFGLRFLGWNLGTG